MKPVTILVIAIIIAGVLALDHWPRRQAAPTVNAVQPNTIVEVVFSPSSTDPDVAWATIGFTRTLPGCPATLRSVRCPARPAHLLSGVFPYLTVACSWTGANAPPFLGQALFPVPAVTSGAPVHHGRFDVLLRMNGADRAVLHVPNGVCRTGHILGALHVPTDVLPDDIIELTSTEYALDAPVGGSVTTTWRVLPDGHLESADKYWNGQ